MHSPLGTFMRAKFQFLLIALLLLMFLVLAFSACGCGNGESAENRYVDLAEFQNNIDLGEGNVIHAEIQGAVLDVQETEYKNYLKLRVSRLNVYDRKGGATVEPGTELVFEVEKEEEIPEQGQAISAVVLAQRSVDGYRLSAHRINVIK